jgi:alpha-mannosidase
LTGLRHHCSYSLVERQVEGIENEFLRLQIDRATGGLQSLLMKKGGLELIAPAEAGSLLEYTVERPHNMSAWLIDSAGPALSPELESVTRLHEGPYKAALELKYRILESAISLIYELRAGDPTLYLSIKVSWFQRGTAKTGVPALSLRLPLALQNARARYEIPFGAIERPFHNHEEVPALQWAQVMGTAGGRKAGCLLVNDCKHGHSLDGSTLRLTLLRSAYNPDPLPEIGDHEISLALRPFAGELAPDQASAAGQAFNRPLKTVSTDVHEGPLPPSASFLQLSGGPVVVTALKRLEDDERLLLRVFNPNPRRITLRIASHAGLLGTLLSAQPLDLMERPCGKPHQARNGKVAVSIGPHGFMSLGLKLSNTKRNT